MAGWLLLILIIKVVSAVEVPLGCYVGNPHGNNAAEMRKVNNRFAAFSTALGKTPTYMNAFVDASQDFSQWVSNSEWTAWSWTKSNASNMIPVLGVPMLPLSQNSKANLRYDEIVSGKYDSVFTGIITAWSNQGYKDIYARIGWEMNGNWYSWAYAHANVTKWNLAFRHIATKLRSVSGTNVRIVWNPTIINWQPINAGTTGYPGDAYVDIIGLDAYSTVWPGGLYNWDGSNKNAPDVKTFSQLDVNREHFWDWPAANEWNPKNEAGWGMVQHIRLAQARNKSVAICECGVGINPDHPNNGLADDIFYPKYLRNRLEASGLNVSFIMIWDVNLHDGRWEFSNGTKPNTANAWKEHFGSGALTPTTIAPTSKPTATPPPTTASTTTPTTSATPIPSTSTTTLVPSTTSATTTGISADEPSSAIRIPFLSFATFLITFLFM